MAARPRRRIIAILIAIVITSAALAVISTFAVSRLLQEQAPFLPYGELRVGVDTSYFPFAMLNDGEFSGIDAEIAQALAEQLGTSLRFVPLGFDGLYDALYTDQVDALISAIIPNPARRDRVNYSEPYFNAGLVLIAPDQSPIASMNDIAGRQLALAFGSTAQGEANRWLRRIPLFDILPYERPNYALDALRIGDSDAALVDQVSARLYQREHPDWKTRLSEVTVVPYAIATRADRGRLSAAIDAALEEMQTNGTLSAIFSRYL
jgi:polar amino acid transport system substrate-binding protein